MCYLSTRPLQGPERFTIDPQEYPDADHAYAAGAEMIRANKIKAFRVLTSGPIFTGQITVVEQIPDVEPDR